MAAVAITLHCLVYPKNKTVQPFPATIVGLASYTDVGVGGGPIEPPPDITPIPPDWEIWPSPGDPDFPIDILPDPPPDETPPVVEKPHEGWNWSVVKGSWYYLYVPGEGDPQPKGGRRG